MSTYRHDCSAKNPASLSSELEEPGNPSGNKDLPDVIESVTLEEAQPDIHGQDQKQLRGGAHKVPNIVNPVHGCASIAVHVEVFAQSVGVKL